MSWLSNLIKRVIDSFLPPPPDQPIDPPPDPPVDLPVHTPVDTGPKLTEERILQAHNISRAKPPKSAITRSLETQFRRYLRDPNIAVLSIHGPSKQGKTSLLRNVLQDRKLGCIMVEASADNPRAELYALILEEAGTCVTRETDTGKKTGTGGSAQVKYYVASAGISGITENETSSKAEHITGSLANATWVARRLAKTTTARIICIDSFHHFDETTQGELAKDFTLFANAGFKVVVAGTWKQSNYIVSRNGDLRSQHAELDVDTWPESDLRKVVEKGAEFLGVTLEQDGINALVSQCCGSISALQMICRKFHETRLDLKAANWSLSFLANHAAQKVTGEQSTDLANAILECSNWGKKKDGTGRLLASYIAEAILAGSNDQLSKGATEDEILARANTYAKAWAERFGVSAMEIGPHNFHKSSRLNWERFQAKQNNTPIFVWDRTVERFFVNDAMLIFVHKTNKDRLINQFTHLLHERVTV